MLQLTFFSHMFSLCVAIGLVLSGCKSLPPKVESRAEVVQRETRIGSELRQQLEAGLKFRQDSEVQVYLRNLAQSLVALTSEIHDSAVGVIVVNDSQRRWQDFSLPGSRIYLSDLLLKKLEFENEVDAALALEIGHLEKKHVISKLRKKLGPATEPAQLQGLLPAQPGQLPAAFEFFGPAGIFTYDDKEQAEAIAVAVRILYEKGIDPRGVVTIWTLLSSVQKGSPDEIAYDAGSLAKYEELTRKEISNYPPLRNPVVKSKEFSAIRKRILTL